MYHANLLQNKSNGKKIYWEFEYFCNAVKLYKHFENIVLDYALQEYNTVLVYNVIERSLAYLSFYFS